MCTKQINVCVYIYIRIIMIIITVIIYIAVCLRKRRDVDAARTLRRLPCHRDNDSRS